jgi:hypothetical protein
MYLTAISTYICGAMRCCSLQTALLVRNWPGACGLLYLRGDGLLRSIPVVAGAQFVSGDSSVVRRDGCP